MRIQLTTAPATEPIDLNMAKFHLRLATTAAEAAAYTTEDGWLNRNIASARLQVEHETGRALITQTRTFYLDAWPDKRYIKLPYPRLQSAVVTYRLQDDDDYDNTLSTVDTDIVSEPGRIILQPNESWPSGTLYTDKPIKIVMVCGYGDDATNVPEDIRNAMLLMIEDAYNHRGEIVLGVSVGRIQGAVDALLLNYIIHTRFD
ncbi:MAG: head-tail connector protein [Candidatus Methanospirareceae archaeon]